MYTLHGIISNSCWMSNCHTRATTTVVLLLVFV